ncbi:hypothetical protein DPMN_004786 [Dreissena polymorpha]|uniref:Uncharacterized protein n=1 Tax=Dreissena polymorpha TaxID=45954 RepID=A0A9D4MRZ0_DREPO|nr:hypothetical protein DPMN_004786 [Dreissena polymorpha]
MDIFSDIPKANPKEKKTKQKTSAAPSKTIFKDDLGVEVQHVYRWRACSSPECTSAVSMAEEGYIYQHIQELTLFTYYLMLDGDRNNKFKKIGEDTSEFGS